MPIMELAVLLVMLGSIVIKLFLILCPKKSGVQGHRWEMRKWARLSRLMFSTVPHLASFSALRLLYYVTPSVVASQFYVELYLCKERLIRVTGVWSRMCAVLPLFVRVWSTIFYLIVGFDAFLVKFRMAHVYISSDKLDFTKILGAFVFLFQLLGVVNLRSFVKERLFLFIFAGEEGNLDSMEKSRWDTWLCLLSKRIFEEFGFFKGVVVMLAFDDYDFQKLVLDDAKRVAMRSVRKGPKLGDGAYSTSMSGQDFDALFSCVARNSLHCA